MDPDNQLSCMKAEETQSTGGSKQEPLLSDVLFESVLVCPVCGFAKRETMPTDACQFFYECVNCKTLLRPKSGDYCVFCSYGSVKCPPMQGNVIDPVRRTQAVLPDGFRRCREKRP